MTIAQRDLLRKFSAGDTPLCRAIAAALYDIDFKAAEIERLKTAVPARVCAACDGTGYYVLRKCPACEGKGRIST